MPFNEKKQPSIILTNNSSFIVIYNRKTIKDFFIQFNSFYIPMADDTLTVKHPLCYFIQNGINSAFHESIGDAVSYGATSLRHMHRLGLIRNEFASSGNSSEANSRLQDSLEVAFLLKQALLKIPQLSSGLIIEKWRWSVFSGKTKPSKYNTFWWSLHRRYMGIVPPSPRSDKFFDPAAKFHIAHGIPYAG